MSFLEYNIKTVPTGFNKILYFNWALLLLICAVAAAGFLMLYSVANDSIYLGLRHLDCGWDRTNLVLAINVGSGLFYGLYLAFGG
jgi:hypothetical protein